MDDLRWGLVALVVVSLATATSAEIKGFDDDLSDGGVAVVVNLDPGSGARTIPPEYAACPAGGNPTNTVFGVGFTSGYAFVPGSPQGSATLYGLEYEGSNTYLYTLDDAFCATGRRVGTQPVGHPNLESLTYSCLDGFLYSVAFDTDAHIGYLIRIDRATGIGTRISQVDMPRDVWITGLAYNPETSGFLGVSNGFAERNFQELYVITTAGFAIMVGPTFTAPQELQSLVIDAHGRILASGDRLYELDPSLGRATPIGNQQFPGTLWAMADRGSLCGTVATPTLPPTTAPTATPTPPPATPTPSSTRTPTSTRVPTATFPPVPPAITTGAIGPSDTTIFVDDVSRLPPRGTMRIDDEIIRYDGLQILRVATSGGAPSVPGALLNVQRGVDGSTPAAHPSGSIVIFLKSGCTGDCNNDDTVSINELVTGVNIALNRVGVERCAAMDANRNGSVSVNELVGAVRAALDGC